MTSQQSVLNELFGVSGKVAIVTGGTSGIGLMIAKGFVQAGITTCIVSRKAEELANALSHGFGFLMSVTLTVLIILAAGRNNDAWHITASAVFGTTLILLYFSSTMNHSLIHGKAKDFFEYSC